MKSQTFALFCNGMRPGLYNLCRSQRQLIYRSASDVATPATRTKTSTTTVLHKKKICIVGAGPAGFYAAQYLVKNLDDAEVDIMEKLPVPFGLVRFGVAPDHPEVKNVINSFTKTAEHPRVRYLGNLSLGKDITLRELRDSYHAVILAYGAEHDRPLNIENENERTVLSAREFVAWYNGLPGAEHFQPNLSERRTVAIIGQGNVAVDVARILLSPVDALQRTDITQHALAALATSSVERVYLIGRRGPLQAAFTIKELREMTKLAGTQIHWRSDDFLGVTGELPNLARPRRRLTELMLSSLTAQQQRVGIESGKQLLPVFLRSPKHISETCQLTLTVNRLSGDGMQPRAVPTDGTELIDSDLVLRSIGYTAISVDADINFNDAKGFVNNHGGRVLKRPAAGSDISIDSIEEKYERGLYASGWLATGPTGVILTTMNNSFAVAHTVVADFASGAIDAKALRPGLVAAKLHDTVVTWEGWQRIDKAEMAAGKGCAEKPREKIIDIQKMLEIAVN